jgi:Arc/MetJ-type ribon-helix-helix transcriptional regulator
MERIKKTITIPKDLVEWAEKVIKNGEYPGIRSLSGFIEYLIRNERERRRYKKHD